MRWKKPALGRLCGAGILCLLAVCGCGTGSEAPSSSADAETVSGATSCEDKDNLFQQIDCYADLATESGDPARCGAAAHEGVRYQCYAIVAERRQDAGICAEIPTVSEELRQLRDTCISDVAAKLNDPELCEKIETSGLRDSCFLKVAESTGDTALCEKIQDPGLKSTCTGKPVTVQ